MENSCIRTYADTVLIKECQKKVRSVEVSVLQLSKVLSLTGNEVRLKILYLLQQEENLCVCDLGDILQMTIPAVSQHLKKLKDGGLIQSRRQGQTIYYSLKEEQLHIVKPLFEHISTTNRKKQKT
ncbi:MAG: ArsR family transcriptional regulator [Sphingobacteriales bacterium]|nr:MAG: ArsR family transcriptional regulator [Sphingobacteriales bacterium]